jgi:outer membrane receptor protein involved in Fe transport
VDVLGNSRIKKTAGRTTPEIVAEMPGVMVQKTNHGGGSAFIRGFTGQHVLYLVDGIRLNNATTRYGPNQALNTIDPFTIRRIEMLRGPGSMLYGSDALGGVIRIMTRQPPMTPGARFRWGGEATARFGTTDRSMMYNLGAWTQYRRAAVLVGGTYKDYNTLMGGRDIGQQRWTGYHEGDWDGAVRVLLAKEWELKLAVAGVRQMDVPRTDQCSPTDFRYYSKQFRDLVYAKVSGSHGRYLDRFDVVLSYHNQRELRERFRLALDRIDREKDRVHTAGFALTAGTHLGKYSRLTYGADLYFDWVNSNAHREIISTGVFTFMGQNGFRGRFVDGSSYLQGGIFAQDEIKPLKWLWVTVGGRVAFSHAMIPKDPLAGVFGFPSEAINATFVGPVGGTSLTFVPWKGLHLITSVQQGYRAPNLDDYSHVGSEGPGFDIPSPDLDKAEKSTTLEAGVKLAHKWIFAWVFGHYSFLDDFIIRTETGFDVDGQPATVRVNAADGYIAGVEGYAVLRLPKGFDVSTWIAWTRGDVTAPFGGGKQPIRRIPPLQGRASVGYRHKTKVWARLAVRWAARQDRLSPGDLNDGRICPDGSTGCNGTPGFAILNFDAGMPLNKYADLTLRIHNLTNEAYKFHGSGVYGPGFSAVVQLRIRYK